MIAILAILTDLVAATVATGAGFSATTGASTGLATAGVFGAWAGAEEAALV